MPDVVPVTELRRAQYLMGTTVEILAYADGPTGGAAVDAAFEEFERLQRAFDPFDDESELSRVNRSAANAPVEVSPEVFALVAVEFDVERFAVGLFDSECQLGLARGLKPEVEIITDRAAVDLDDAVICLQLELVADAAGRDLSNDHPSTPQLRHRRCYRKLVHIVSFRPCSRKY